MRSPTAPAAGSLLERVLPLALPALVMLVALLQPVGIA